MHKGRATPNLLEDILIFLSPQRWQLQEGFPQTYCLSIVMDACLVSNIHLLLDILFSSQPLALRVDCGLHSKRVYWVNWCFIYWTVANAVFRWFSVRIL